MRVLVLCASQYGATKGIAECVTGAFQNHGLTADLAAFDDEANPVDLESYDAYVLGSAIHASAGHWLKPAIEFVREHKVVLAAHPSWLFSSGPIGDKYVDAPQPDPKEIAEVRELLDVRGHTTFAGAFDPESVDEARANWLEKAFARRFIPAGDWRNWSAIEAWATDIADALVRAPVAIGAAR